MGLSRVGPVGSYAASCGLGLTRGCVLQEMSSTDLRPRRGTARSLCQAHRTDGSPWLCGEGQQAVLGGSERAEA